MKPLKLRTIFFYNELDSTEANDLAKAEREVGRVAMTRDATSAKIEFEECDVVVIMPEVRDHHRERVRKVFGNREIVERKPHEEESVTVVLSGLDRRGKASLDYSGPLHEMTNKALRVLAIQRGVDVQQYKTRDEMIAALEAHKAAEAVA